MNIYIVAEYRAQGIILFAQMWSYLKWYNVLELPKDLPDRIFADAVPWTECCRERIQDANKDERDYVVTETNLAILGWSSSRDFLQ